MTHEETIDLVKKLVDNYGYVGALHYLRVNVHKNMDDCTDKKLLRNLQKKDRIISNTMERLMKEVK